MGHVWEVSVAYPHQNSPGAYTLFTVYMEYYMENKADEKAMIRNHKQRYEHVL